MAAKGQPRPKTSEQTLDALGIEAVCERIEAGDTYREIATALQVRYPSLLAWLNRADNANRSARAREASAEAWLDRGLDKITDALSKDGGIDASAARAYAQECARRAALRNPRYVDKTAHEHSGPGGSAIPMSIRVSFK